MFLLLSLPSDFIYYSHNAGFGEFLLRDFLRRSEACVTHCCIHSSCSPRLALNAELRSDRLFSMERIRERFWRSSLRTRILAKRLLISAVTALSFLWFSIN